MILALIFRCGHCRAKRKSVSVVRRSGGMSTHSVNKRVKCVFAHPVYLSSADMIDKRSHRFSLPTRNSNQSYSNTPSAHFSNRRVLASARELKWSIPSGIGYVRSIRCSKSFIAWYARFVSLRWRYNSSNGVWRGRRIPTSNDDIRCVFSLYFFILFNILWWFVGGENGGITRIIPFHCIDP